MMSHMVWRILLVAMVAAGCSGAEPLNLAESPPDGVLDCTDDSSWGIQGTPDPEAEGFATADGALADSFVPFMSDNDELRGPQSIDENTASLLNAQNREVVVASASEVTPDNWFVVTVSGCSGFERF